MSFSLMQVTFAIYLIVIFALGWAAWKQTKTHQDYLLGGRRLGPMTTALSAGASDMSGWLLLGLPGLAYDIGLGALWLAMGLLVGTWLNWQLVAPRLRRETERLNSVTLPTWLERRFNDSSHSLRILSALFILVFFLLYTSSGLVAGGKLFAEAFGMPYQHAVIAGVVCIGLYTLFGGFLAVSWTDVVQALLMLAVLIGVPMFVAALIREDASLMQHAATRGDLFYVLYDANGKPFSLLEIISLCAWGLGYFGQPHILARFKAIRDPRQLTRAQYIAVSWSFLTLVGAIAVGISGAMYFSDPLADSEKVLIALSHALFHPLIAGILIAAILAAIMSTADSQLLVCASAISEDLYLKRTPAHSSAGMARWCLLIMATVATILAMNPEAGVLDLVSYAWAGFGATFGPVILFALYWKACRRWGAIAGILLGGGTVMIWKNLSGGLFDLYEIVPGFVAACLGIVVFSYLEFFATKQSAANP
ncbi:MAG: sodium/proline symporter PutP [Pseudomonadales bacterium]|nr:sodium/proline symporter PutP [Pseudomonadales bacterium]